MVRAPSSVTLMNPNSGIVTKFPSAGQIDVSSLVGIVSSSFVSESHGFPSSPRGGIADFR